MGELYRGGGLGSPGGTGQPRAVTHTRESPRETELTRDRLLRARLSWAPPPGGAPFRGWGWDGQDLISRGLPAAALGADRARRERGSGRTWPAG